MTLDEAIEHEKEVSRTCEDSACAADHMQLAEWLRQARGADAAGRWYTAKLRDAEAENAKLRADLKDVVEILVECVRSQDEIGDKLNVGIHVMPVVAAHLRELGIEVS